ncbi:MAG TPA: SPOR domain-containing protein [Paludibacteraceae bacterium]|nr:SPOR domain-containing protein [Paludibacteraceae bacterium]HPT42979.1 SPOR domain-containing protein [Paludibacteraceae bacterium]
MKRFILMNCVLLALMFTVTAQNGSNSATPEIIKSIENGDSKVNVHQDSRLNVLLNDHVNREIKPSGPYSGPGYRVQVFSSNDFKTAKSESASIERQLRSTFPEQNVYRIYASPFWKVRVGDFRSIEEARTFRAELINAFPNLSREAYTVRESKIKIE